MLIEYSREATHTWKIKHCYLTDDLTMPSKAFNCFIYFAAPPTLIKQMPNDVLGICFKFNPCYIIMPVYQGYDYVTWKALNTHLDTNNMKTPDLPAITPYIYINHTAYFLCAKCSNGIKYHQGKCTSLGRGCVPGGLMLSSTAKKSTMKEE